MESKEEEEEEHGEVMEEEDKSNQGTKTSPWTADSLHAEPQMVSFNRPNFLLPFLALTHVLSSASDTPALRGKLVMHLAHP